MTSGCSRQVVMTKPDMSPKAVTVRLIRTAQLRKLCLQLAKKPHAAIGSRPPAAGK